MRNLFIVFFSSLLLFVSCDNTTVRQLEQIESLLPHEVDSAAFLLEAVDVSTRLSNWMAQLNDDEEMYYGGLLEMALNWLENYVDLEQELVDVSISELLVRAQTEYNYEKVERENLELRLENYKNRISLYQIVGMALFIIIAIFYLLRIKVRQLKRLREQNRKLKQEKEAIEQLYQHTLLDVKQNEKEIKRLTHVVEQDKELPKSTLREVEKQIQQLQSEQRSNQSTLNLLGRNIRESAVFLKFYQVGSEAIEITEADWASLQTLIETAYPDFLSRLFANYSPSQKEIRLCLLLKTGLSVTAIAELLSCTVSSVSATRSRLYTKITGKKGSAHDLDIYVWAL